MSEQQKRICMIARSNPPEALRMATGLTLLGDPVAVAALGTLSGDDAVAEQLEALEFADVPVTELQESDDLGELVELVYQSDVVFCI